MSEDLHCWNCNEPIQDTSRSLSRHLACTKCFEFLHCCKMCHFFSTGAPGQCDHDLTDPPAEKTSANFCDYFSPSHRQGTDSRQQHLQASQSLDDLFGDADQTTVENKADEDINTRLSSLFDDD